MFVGQIASAVNTTQVKACTAKHLPQFLSFFSLTLQHHITEMSSFSITTYALSLSLSLSLCVCVCVCVCVRAGGIILSEFRH